MEKEKVKIGPCGYAYSPFDCQNMSCYDECKDSEVKENPDKYRNVEETTNVESS